MYSKNKIFKGDFLARVSFFKKKNQILKIFLFYGANVKGQNIFLGFYCDFVLQTLGFLMGDKKICFNFFSHFLGRGAYLKNLN